MNMKGKFDFVLQMSKPQGIYYRKVEWKYFCGIAVCSRYAENRVLYKFQLFKYYDYNYLLHT